MNSNEMKFNDCRAEINKNVRFPLHIYQIIYKYILDCEMCNEKHE